MEEILNKGERVDSLYDVKFYVDGDAYSQKYRVVDEHGDAFFSKIYDSSKLSKHDFSKEQLLEVEILEQLDIDGVIGLHHNGEIVKGDKKYHYLITDFISGETLQDKLQREGAFSQHSAVPIVIKVLETLSAMHTHNKVIIHNNIDLQHVALDYSDAAGKPTLTNFGAARYLSSKSNSINLKRLNPFYIAPELYNGVFTPQSDVFSAGALLYQLISGVPPWYIEIPKFKRTEEKFIDALIENRNKQLSFGAEDIDEHLKETIKKALAIDVDDRFRSAGEFIKYLNREKVLEGSGEKKPKATGVKKEGKGFSAIAGMGDLKELLYNDVIRALNEQELYESYGVTIPNGMLLYGPPGCGKTFISERFSEEVGFNFIELKPSDMKSKWLNETEQKIGAIFKEAEENAPTIIFIDEFDAIVPSREGELHQSTASAVNEILAQMSNCSERGIFVIAASNRPEKIDPAVLRTGRVDRVIYLSPPDYQARKAMFELYLKDRPVDLDVDYDALSNKTENYVSSDIKFLIDEASRTALKTKAKISQEILITVLSETLPSVSYSEIEKYEQLKEQLENKKGAIETKKRSIGFIQTDD